MERQDQQRDHEETDIVEIEQVSRVETVVRNYDERNSLISEVIHSVTHYQAKQVFELPTGMYL